MAESSPPDSCLKGGKFSAPGFRFHPTDEELVMYYLKRKICRRRLRINAIGVVDVYKLDPEELPGQSLLKSGDRQWFFFTPRSRKYPNAARSSRGTLSGYWKATGKDRIIEYNSRSVGIKKTLVFYRGRAPNGERTDWVMHEYTMDEDELLRCKSSAKDYYALYKLFKKSGSGPKNGEQYGAPFQEEEWADVDDNNVQEEDPVVSARSVNDAMLFNPVNVQLSDIEELLREIPDAPIAQVNSGEELKSTVMNSYGELLSNGKAYNMQPSFEVTSAPNTNGMVPLVLEREDYIEIDDLLSPELGLNHGGFGEFNEFDQLFHDVSMSLDMEPIAQGASTAGPSSLNKPDQREELIYQQPPGNNLNNIMGNNQILDQFSDDIWLQDDQALVFDQPQSFSQAFDSFSSGVMMPASTNPTMSVVQEQEGENGGGTSPFTSALWAFMESIPSTPASACEGPLNRTFVRMSSFSRMSFNGMAKGTAVTTTVAKKRMGNRWFLLLSIVGALCAILWVLVAAVRVSGRPLLP